MKGNISLQEFIDEVKAELKEANKTDDPFFEIEGVELEVSFALEAQGKGRLKFWVVDVGGGAKAHQTHKVTLKLLAPEESKPTKKEKKASSSGGRGSGRRPGRKPGKRLKG